MFMKISAEFLNFCLTANNTSRDDMQQPALPSVAVTHLDDDFSIRFDSTDELKAMHLEIVSTVKELLATSYFYKEHFDQVRKKMKSHRQSGMLSKRSFLSVSEYQFYTTISS